MILRKIRSEGLAHLSYLIGSGKQAAVIDPRRDVDDYIEIAHDEGLSITHVFETHRNEDYIIGSRELAARTGAEIYHHEATEWGYGSNVAEGDSFTLGQLRLEIIHTPGHTFDSISIAVYDTEFSDEDAVAVFTGDALFIGDVGRTDFFPDQREHVAGLLYDSIFEKLLPLGDQAILYPEHGAGSVCGDSMADREFSTLGYERAHNSVLQMTDRDEFVQYKAGEFHHMPMYFDRIHSSNQKGPELLRDAVGELPAPMSAMEVNAFCQGGGLVLDLRGAEAFGGAHIPGALNIAFPMLSAYIGYEVDYGTPLALVVNNRAMFEAAWRQLQRIDYVDVAGWLEGGMEAWAMSALPFDSIPQIFVEEIKRRYDEGEEFLLLDVRKDSEFEKGSLQGAQHIFVGELQDRIGEIGDTRPIVTFCGTGYRASNAASILKRNGLREVENFLGSMKACMESACPIE
ncbi:MAG: MBL fold metallo-hydrolase [Armatimonadota bacterium]|jgi:hydroxyacylglutathione hydrolase